ncbi:M42 family metallopeptidase [Bdellovibrionota bacterium]
MRTESLNFLKKLVTTPSPSGFETRGTKVWLDYVKKFADKTYSDSYGNAYAILNPDGDPKIFISGHSDEIGLMVNYIDDKGFIYATPIGGIDYSVSRGKRLTIHSEKGPVPGVIGATAIHIWGREDTKKIPKIHEQAIDIGVKNKKEAEKLVQVGDPITYIDDFTTLGKDIAVARAFDNRIGTFTAAETLRICSSKKINACLIAVSAVQEEITMGGARIAANRINPDVAIVVDVTHATDSPGIDPKRYGDVKLGSGPAITYGSINHPAVLKRLEEIAKKKKLPVQREANGSRTGTDADAVFNSHCGIPTVTLGLPNRYMHTPSEMISLNDLTQLCDLTAGFVLSLKTKERFKVEIK